MSRRTGDTDTGGRRRKTAKDGVCMEWTWTSDRGWATSVQHSLTLTGCQCQTEEVTWGIGVGEEELSRIESGWNTGRTKPGSGVAASTSQPANTLRGGQGGTTARKCSWLSLWWRRRPWGVTAGHTRGGGQAGTQSLRGGLRKRRRSGGLLEGFGEGKALTQAPTGP